MVEENPRHYYDTNVPKPEVLAEDLSHVAIEERGSIDVYFDSVTQAPQDEIQDCELCFCLQRDGEVL